MAFIASVFWLHFPAILKGWVERVVAYGDAYALTSAGWCGEAKGRAPLLHRKKALVISTTLFQEEDYKADGETPMTRTIDDWGLRYPGAKHVEHVYFYGVPVVDDETRQGYLKRAYELRPRVRLLNYSAPLLPLVIAPRRIEGKAADHRSDPEDTDHQRRALAHAIIQQRTNQRQGGLGVDVQRQT